MIFPKDWEQSNEESREYKLWLFHQRKHQALVCWLLLIRGHTFGGIWVTSGHVKNTESYIVFFQGGVWGGTRTISERLAPIPLPSSKPIRSTYLQSWLMLLTKRGISKKGKLDEYWLYTLCMHNFSEFFFLLKDPGCHEFESWEQGSLSNPNRSPRN